MNNKLTIIPLLTILIALLSSCSQFGEFAEEIDGTWSASEFILEGQEILPGVISETLFTFSDYRRDVGQVLIEITYTDGRMIVYEGEYVFMDDGDSIEMDVVTTVPEVGDLETWTFDKVISGNAMILDGRGLVNRPLAFELRKQ